MRIEFLNSLSEDDRALLNYCLNELTPRINKIPYECFSALRGKEVIMNLESHLPKCTDESKPIMESLIQKFKDEYPR
jgi:hypothetical protein